MAKAKVQHPRVGGDMAALFIFLARQLGPEQYADFALAAIRPDILKAKVKHLFEVKS